MATMTRTAETTGGAQRRAALGKPDPMHCHKCRACGLIWQHPDSTGDPETSPADFRRAHTCTCGEFVDLKHWKDEQSVKMGLCCPTVPERCRLRSLVSDDPETFAAALVGLILGAKKP